MQPSRKRTAEQQSGSANTGDDAGPSSRRQRGVKQEPAGAVAIKQEPSEADLPGDGLHPDALQRTLDTVTSALPQLITAVSTLAQTASDMKRDAETISTSLAAVLTEMKKQLTTVASAQLQTAAVLAELKTEMVQIKRHMDEATRDQAQRDKRAILQRAMSHADSTSFKYYATYTGLSKSCVDAQDVLQAFLSGDGLRLDNERYISDKVEAHPTEDQKRAYRDALQEQIQNLTGTRPELLRLPNAAGEMQWVLRWPENWL